MKQQVLRGAQAHRAFSPIATVLWNTTKEHVCIFHSFQPEYLEDLCARLRIWLHYIIFTASSRTFTTETNFFFFPRVITGAIWFIAWILAWAYHLHCIFGNTWKAPGLPESKKIMGELLASYNPWWDQADRTWFPGPEGKLVIAQSHIMVPRSRRRKIYSERIQKGIAINKNDI